MTPTAQRIALGEHEGWTTYAGEKPSHHGHLVAQNPAGHTDMMPDYLNDWSSLTRIVQGLKPADRLCYADYLNIIVDAFHDDYYEGWHSADGFAKGILDIAEAPLAARAEAILKTLGRWEINA